MNLALLLMITIISSAGEETGEWVIPDAALQPTPTPTATPVPSPSPRTIPLELYFSRPAKIIPIHGSEEEFEVAEEVPWLTDDDILFVEPPVEGETPSLLLYFTPDGNQKYREAMMGNIGRTVIFSLDGTSRYTTKMVPAERKNQFLLYGDFTFEEARRIAEQVNNRPAPTPTPEATPSPAKRQRFIIE